LAYCSKLSNRLLEKLATPMALVSPSSTVCSKASQVLLMSSGRKSSCRGGNPEPFLNFNGQCMRYKSRYSNCKSLCTHNKCASSTLSLSDRLCLLSALSHWPVNNRLQRWWLIPSTRSSTNSKCQGLLWKRDEDTRRTRETAHSLLTLDFFVPFVGHPVAHVQLMEALMSQTLHPVLPCLD
jgi:hypothetical protein